MCVINFKIFIQFSKLTARDEVAFLQRVQIDILSVVNDDWI